jgi:DNA-binding transcriptional LysR family regulator
MDAIRSGGSLVRELEQGVTGELALAVAPAVSAYVLPEILVRFTELHPNVRLLVRTGHSEEIGDLVARGQVELGIIRHLRDARVRSSPLYEDELVMVVPPGHPFAQLGAVDVSEIRHAQLILFDRTSSYYDVTNALFRIAGVVPRGVMEVDNIEAAKRMVERGLESRCSRGRRSPTPSMAVRFERSSSSARPRSGAKSWRSNVPVLGRHGRFWRPCGGSSIAFRS